jgi:hypothetical protein
MNYAVEVASGDMVYIPRFIRIISGIRKLLAWDTHKLTGREQGDPISSLLHFENKGNSLKAMLTAQLPVVGPIIMC